MSTRQDALRAELDAAHAELLALVEQFQQTDWSRAVNPAWDAHDVLAHLSDAEGGLRLVIDVARFGLSVPVPDAFVHLLNRAQVNANRPRAIAELLAKLEAVRARTLQRLDALTERDLDKRAFRPLYGRGTIESLFRDIAVHEAGHVQAIKEVLMADSRVNSCYVVPLTISSNHTPSRGKGS